MKKLILVLMCLIVAGCSGEPPVTQKYVVERVFQQQPGVYSLLVREGEELRSVSLNTYEFRCEWHLFIDADSNGPMTAEVTTWGDSFNKFAKMVVHIHSVKNIDATGYSAGGKPPQQVEPKVIE